MWHLLRKTENTSGENFSSTKEKFISNWEQQKSEVILVIVNSSKFKVAELTEIFS